MKIGSFLKIMGLITFMAILYIHMQMKIYDLAYQGKRRTNHIDQLAENNTSMRNDILRLQSSDNMGRALLVDENSYKFISKSNVVEVESQRGEPKFGVMALAGLNF